MLQHNQRAVEAQAKLMKSNSNSLLPGLPPRILSFNNSLNMAPNTASVAQAELSQQNARQKRVSVFAGDHGLPPGQVSKGRESQGHPRANANVIRGPQEPGASSGIDKGYMVAMPPLTHPSKGNSGYNELSAHPTYLDTDRHANLKGQVAPGSMPLRTNDPYWKGP
jgi:hypothetical protein